MDKNVAATKVASRLFAAEAAIDAAMMETSKLLETMVQARREVNIAVPALDVAEARVAEAIAALAQTRRATVAAHGAMANVERKYGIQHTATGGQSKNPPSAISDEAVCELRVAS
jgi:hypothetical protein